MISVDEITTEENDQSPVIVHEPGDDLEERLDQEAAERADKADGLELTAWDCEIDRSPQLPRYLANINDPENLQRAIRESTLKWEKLAEGDVKNNLHDKSIELIQKYRAVDVEIDLAERYFWISSIDLSWRLLLTSPSASFSHFRVDSLIAL